MIKLLRITLITCTVTGLLAGCGVPAQLAQQERDAITLPASYQSSSDSAAAILPQWNQFFTDTNLTRLIKAGLTHNQDLQASLQRIRSAQAEILQQKGLLSPSVSAGITGSLRKFGLYTMDGAGNIVTDMQPGKLIPIHLPDYFAGIQASWELDIWQKLKNKKQAAMARYLAGIEGRNLLVTQLVSSIATAYYELLATDEMLKIIDETIQVREKALELVKVQKESAMSNELAVKQFEAQLYNLGALRWELLQQVAQTENSIHLLTGQLPVGITRVHVFFESPLHSYLKTGVPSALLQQRPDIRQAEWNLVATKAEVKAARAAFYPSVNINGSLGLQAFQPGLLLRTPESIAYGLVGGLTAPLINRSAIKSNFQKANAVQLEAYYQYQKQVLNGYIEVNTEIQRAQNLANVYNQRSKETETLLHSIDIAEILFKAGRASYLEVLVTQQNALQARLSMVDTRRKQFLTTVNLYRTLGGGWR
ncbi:MAG: efflux transporter outer membrane subunit [Bacteroidota bacterium]